MCRVLSQYRKSWWLGRNLNLRLLHIGRRKGFIVFTLLSGNNTFWKTYIDKASRTHGIIRTYVPTQDLLTLCEKRLMNHGKIPKSSLTSEESEKFLNRSLNGEENDINNFGQELDKIDTSAAKQINEAKKILIGIGRENNSITGEIQTVNVDSNNLAPVILRKNDMNNNSEDEIYCETIESAVIEQVQERMTSSPTMATTPTKFYDEKHLKEISETPDLNPNEGPPDFLETKHLENLTSTYQHSLLSEEFLLGSSLSDTQLDQRSLENSNNIPETKLSQPNERLESKKIHVIGMGPTGQYIAHHISQLNHAPAVILLMHDPLIMQKWHDEGAAIRILKNDKIFTQTGFHVESSSSFRTSSPDQKYFGFGENLEQTTKPPDYAIDSLIVATNSFVTIAALNSIKHRIKPSTVVCIIEKGMGVVQKLNKLFFTNSTSRPTYVLGQLSHELAPTEYQFTHIEKGPAELYCSKLPRAFLSNLELGSTVERIDFSWSPGAKHLVGTLLRVPEFNTITLGHKDFHVKQLLNLATCAVIEPLAVAFDCANGQLLYNYGVTYFMRKLLQEISLIITSLPELRNIKNIKQLFGPEQLERKIIGHLQHSKVTVSPMLVDLRAGQRTSIDFYTGYLIERAIEIEIPCPINQMIYNLVRGKQTIKRRKDNKYIPFT